MSSSSSTTSPSTALTNELLNFLCVHEEGVPDAQISSHFGARYKDLVPVINDLLRTNRLQLFTSGVSGLPIYRAIKEETASKLDGLGREQILIYQICERAGNKGIWKQDIRLQSNITQAALDKILKMLEQRLLIKSVRSIGSKTKRLYMLYDVTPAKEVTGGPWYTDQEFDHEFVDALCTFILQFIQSQGMTDMNTISTRVKKSGIANIDLSPEELELVIQTLIYDGRIEEVQMSVLQFTGRAASQTMYKISKPITIPNYLTDSPCGVCPLIHRCFDGGDVSPSTCEYYTEWLESDVDMTW